MCGVGGGESRHGDFGGEELDSIGDSVGLCLGDEDFVAPVVFERRSYIPAVVAVRGPRGTFVRLAVDDDFGTWRGK